MPMPLGLLGLSLIGGSRVGPALQLLLGEPGFALDGIAIDLAIQGGGVDWQGDPNSLLTNTSPPTQYIRNASGIYVPGTTMRCDHLANGTALGLLIEGQRTNEIRNNSMQGVSAGSPGTLPTNWVQSNGAGLTRTIVGSGTANGIEYVDIRFAGTTGDSQGMQLAFETATQIAAASADVWAPSFFLALVGGSISNLSTVNVNACERTSGGIYVTEKSGSDIKGSLSAALQRFSAALTLNGGGTVARAQPRLLVGASSGVAVDYTVRIGWPQFEKAAFASSPIRTTSAAVTRAADNISLATSLFPFNATKGTLLAKVVPGNIGSGVWVLARLRQDGTNFITLVQNTAAKQGQVDVGGVTQVALSSGSAVVGTAYKSAFSWKANDFGFSSNGGVIQTDPTGSLPTPTTLYFGSANGSSGHFEGWLQQLIYLPRDMSDAELVAWSAL